MKKTVGLIILALIFLFGLYYLLIPGPTYIGDFPPLPNSVTSQLSGDTWQHPNIVAYFSNWWRPDVTPYYYKSFSYLKIFGVTIPPLKINHPPEEAFQYIRDQQESTYLEEYFYPFRDQLFVNGWEPFDKNGKRFRGDWNRVVYNDIFYNSKVTLRYYPSKRIYRVIVYVGIWASAFALWWVAKKIKMEEV